MKKKLLLLTAVLTASATSFAQNVTVKSNDQNITYTYNSSSDVVVRSDAPGNETPDNTNNTNIISINGNELTINYVNFNKISNRKRDIKVTITKVEDLSKLPKYLTAEEISYEPEPEIVIFQSYIEDFATEDYTYKSNMTTEETEAYYKYVDACEKAIQAGKREVQKGENLKSKFNVDDEGFNIVDEFYYSQSGRNKPHLIYAISGTWKEGTRYDKCYDYYIPTSIAENIGSAAVSGDSKVGIVTGVIDQARFNTIVANNTYLNYDFSNATTLEGITSSIADNKIAYFPQAANATVVVPTGRNVVVNGFCGNYTISDNSQDIYVSTGFTAKEAIYSRNFNTGDYGTIVLPFTINGSTSNIFARTANLTDYDPGTYKLTFTNSGVIEPNTPYIFKVKNGANEVKGNPNTPVLATTEATSENCSGVQFVGTFEKLSKEQLSGHRIITVGGQITESTGDLKPGRCYFAIGQANGAKLSKSTIQIIDEDGSIEEIEVDSEVTAIDGIENGEVVATQYISINGQISNKPFNGMNIVKKTFANGTVETSKVVY